MKRAKPRPICPDCGSADVVVGDKTGTCNRCGEMFRAERARGYVTGVGEQRNSIEERWRKAEGEDMAEENDMRRSMYRG